MHRPSRPKPAFPAALRRAAFVTVAIAETGVCISAAPLAAQDSVVGRAVSPPALSGQATGPLFFTDTAADGHWVEASNNPVLQRRVSLMLVGIPLAAAIDTIARQTAIEMSYTPELLPVGARVSVKADDVTVAAVLRWVLANSGQDVLVTRVGDLTLIPHAMVAEAADSSRAVVGVVVDITNGEPVPFATVALLGTDRARFADSSGHFRLSRLAPRAYRLRARQIGFEPVDTTVVVNDVPRLVSVTLRMHRIPAILGAIHVTGRRGSGCVATGVPDPSVDPTLAAIFVQLRENADRSRLLSDQYPYWYAREERRTLRRSPGGDSTEYVDSTAYESRSRQAYRAGAVLFERTDTLFQRGGPSDLPRYVVRRHMYLPAFTDLADSAFLAAHCFALGATERDAQGPTTFRVDFEPATAIRTPDVEGSIYLDARQLLVRRAFFALTKPQAATPPVISFAVTTTFRPVVPLVPVVDSMGSQQLIMTTHGQTDPARAQSRLALTTERMLGVTFEGETPLRPLPGRVVMQSTAAGDVRTESDSTSLARTGSVGISRARPVFPPDPSCKVRPASDTIGALVYATFQGRRPATMGEATWAHYAGRVLSAIRRSFMLPGELPLPAFSSPFAIPASDLDGQRGVADQATQDGVRVSAMRVVRPAASADSSGVLVGVVLREDGRPLPYASVWLGGSNERVTDTAGVWRLTRLVPGSYSVGARELGYAPVEATIVVHPGPSPTADTIRMTRSPTRLNAVTVNGRRPSLYVAPMLSTVIAVTLDPNGAINDARISASSSSVTADTIVLGAVERAAATRAFPKMDSTTGRPSPVTFDLVVSMNQPSMEAGALAIGRVDVPVWPSDAGAALAEHVMQPHILGDLGAGDPAADTTTLEFVVDARGRPVKSTVRLDRTPGPRNDYAHRFESRLLQSLALFQFTPAVVAGCPVSQFVRQGFGYSIR